MLRESHRTPQAAATSATVRGLSRRGRRFVCSFGKNGPRSIERPSRQFDRGILL